MKKYTFLIFTLLIVLMFISCAQKKGTFVDFASIKNAQRTMIKLNNLMEQYYVENEHYPLNQKEFEEGIRPYFITYNKNNEPTDTWNEMVEKAFKDGKLFYETRDEKITYFIYGRALDCNNTLVFCRPAIPHLNEEE